MKPYLEAGSGGFGLGSSLYTPVMSCAPVVVRAKGFVEVWQRLTPP
jgi:hypothetical protein